MKRLISLLKCNRLHLQVTAYAHATGFYYLPLYSPSTYAHITKHYSRWSLEGEHFALATSTHTALQQTIGTMEAIVL